jgi:hypothetical protein
VVAPPATDLPPGLQLVRRSLRRPVVGGPEVLGRRLRRELDLNTHPGEPPLFCMRGTVGNALVCLDDRLLILKRGFAAGATFGAISATIYYRDVTGIQVGRHLLSGWVEIHSPSFQGGDRKRTPQHSAHYDAFRRPNYLPIRRRGASAYQPALAELRRLVADAKLERARPIRVIESLERLAMLRRRGDIDDREYELAKARILRETAPRWDQAAASS